MISASVLIPGYGRHIQMADKMEAKQEEDILRGGLTLFDYSSSFDEINLLLESLFSSYLRQEIEYD